MVPPAWWWLLALTVLIQGFYFLRMFVLRIRGKGLQPLARRALAILWGSALAGIAYGFVQRDPMFVVGQLCLMFLYYRLQQKRYDQEE